MIREETFIAPSSEFIKEFVDLARGASCVFMNGVALKVPDDLELIQVGDFIAVRYDDEDEVIRRLAKLVEDG